MLSSIDKQKQQNASFLIYYQGFLAVAAILIFFTRIDIYLQDFSSLLPLHWMIGFLAASIPLFLYIVSKRFNYLSKTILLWSGAYIALSLISILIQPTIPELQLLEDQYRTIIFLLMMIIIFTYHPLIHKWIKLTIMSVTILNVGMFVYEFFNPSAFHRIQRAAGRSSGFYDDSNTASIALILGMILTIDMVKPKYRLFYSLFIFLGIAPTFSRGSMIGWTFVLALFLLNKVIPRYQMPALLLFFLIVISVLSTQLSNLGYLKTADGSSLFQEDTLERVEFILDPFGQRDGSQAARISHLEDAWEKFARNPFIGNGLGSGQNTDFISQTGKAQRSHNTFLDLMVEYGFLGALIFPSLLLACVWKAKGKFKKQAAGFVFFLMLQGMFSHTLVSEFCSLIVYAIVANFTEHSYYEELEHLDAKHLHTRF